MASKKVLYPNLMAEMARLGLTITSLADKLGMSRTNLYNKLYGVTNFTLKDITAIQEVLKAADSNGDYTLDYLFSKANQTAY